MKAADFNAMHARDPRPRKYNLLLVASSLHIGGAEIVIRDLSRYLDRQRFNVTICHLKNRGPIGDDMRREGMEVVGIPKSKAIEVDYFSFVKLFRLIQERRIDILHTHTPHGLTDSAICKLLRPRLRLVHTFHFGNYPHEAARRMFMERVFGRLANQLVAVGDHQKQTIEDAYGWAPGTLMTIWNGVTPLKSEESLDLRSIIGGEPRPVIGAICTLYEQKGVTYLLDVAAELKRRGVRAAFVVAGEGPLRRELEEKRARLGLEDTVYLVGWVKDAAARLMPLCDIFFQPSLWEAMSVVILEALAAGKAIVATRVGENPRVLKDGVDGVLVESRDVTQMTNALQWLIKEPETRARLGREARRKFELTFTAERMARSYERLYLNVLGAAIASMAVTR